jgi:hypothetical protein
MERSWMIHYLSCSFGTKNWQSCPLTVLLRGKLQTVQGKPGESKLLKMREKIRDNQGKV